MIDANDHRESGVTPVFAGLLKQHRTGAALTQEELAERAGLSRNAISALERGERTRPQRATVDLLATALGLTGDDRERFAVSARNGPAEPAPATEPPSNLPLPPTPLIGREAVLAQAVDLFQEGHVRLLTLTGPGGVGKTRLALKVAANLRRSFADGAFLVDLAPLRDPAQIAGSIARAFDLREDGMQSTTDLAIAHLRDRHLLLLLDNVEHLVDGATVLADLLAACPGLHLLVTSRAPVHLRGEYVLPVPPLALPDPADPVPLDHLRYIPAIALFVERTNAVDPTFALTDENGPVVTEICRRLDGLPLAIELAAARTPLLPPSALLARLAEAPALPLLTEGARDLPDRQQTLRRTLEWSYDLLDTVEQHLFRTLAIFAGGFTLDAADAVSRETGVGSRKLNVSTPDSRLPSPDSIFGLVASLVGKSLLQRDDPATHRLGMLETVREFARELLTASGEEPATARAHALYFLSLAEEAASRMRSSDRAIWLARLNAEHENLQAALRWSLTSGETEIGLRLAARLFDTWHAHGYLREGRHWLDRLLAQPADVSPAVRARALHISGQLAYAMGDLARSQTLQEESLALHRELGDTRQIANLLSNLGVLAQDRGDLDRAETLLEECLKIDRDFGDRWGLAASLTNFARLARFRGDLKRSRALQTESLALVRELGDNRAIAISLSNLASIARDEGDLTTAESLFEESLALWRDLGELRGIGVELMHLGQVATDLGDTERAESLLVESITRLHALDTIQDTLSALEALAPVTISRGRPRQAVLLLSAAGTLRDTLGAPRPPDEQISHVNTVQAARAALSADVFATAWEDGAGRSLDEAVAIASARDDLRGADHREDRQSAV